MSTGEEGSFSFGGVVLADTKKSFNKAFPWDATTKRFGWKPIDLEHQPSALAASKASDPLLAPFAASGRLLFTRGFHTYTYSGLFISPSRFVTSYRFMRRIPIELRPELQRHPVLISNSAFAPNETIRSSEYRDSHWAYGALISFDSEEDFAVFELLERKVKNFVPISGYYSGHVAKGDNVVAIGYHGAEPRVVEFWYLGVGRLPDWAVRMNPNETYLNRLLHFDIRTLSPGQIVEKPAQAPRASAPTDQRKSNQEDLVRASFSVTFGLYGAPVFLLAPANGGYAPHLIGYVCKLSSRHNHNKLKRYNAKLLEMATSALSEEQQAMLTDLAAAHPQGGELQPERFALQE